MRTTRRIAIATKLALVCLLAAAALAHASNFRLNRPMRDRERDQAGCVPREGPPEGHLPRSEDLDEGQGHEQRARPHHPDGLKIKVRSTVVGCPSSSLKITPFKGHKAIKGDATDRSDEAPGAHEGDIARTPVREPGIS